MSPPDELIEYQEGNRIAMAYAQFTLMAGSIFISASFAILGLSFNIQKSTQATLILMIASLMLYLIYLVYDKRYTRITHEIIFPTLQDFERKKMKMQFHAAIDDADKKWKKKCRLNYTVLRIRTWIYGGLAVLVVLWALRMLCVT